MDIERSFPFREKEESSISAEMLYAICDYRQWLSSSRSAARNYLFLCYMVQLSMLVKIHEAGSNSKDVPEKKRKSSTLRVTIPLDVFSELSKVRDSRYRIHIPPKSCKLTSSKYADRFCIRSE